VSFTRLLIGNFFCELPGLQQADFRRGDMVRISVAKDESRLQTHPVTVKIQEKESITGLITVWYSER
jgi:hypothetical protein